MRQIQEQDVVALLNDIPEHGLVRGDVGTVVAAFVANEYHPGGYIVEFVDEHGRVYQQVDIADDARLMRLHFNFQREAA